MSTWFTSDLHLGHRLVAGHRGFGEDTAAHDLAIVKNWQRVVHKDDIVWVLGDLSVSDPTTALAILKELPGRKRFVSGNHDPIHPMHRGSHRWAARFAEVFEFVQPFARVKWDGHYYLMSHFPYNKDRHEVRYTQYRLRDEGMWLLHGHTHGKERLEGHEIHVGLDAWGMQLVPFETIRDLRREAEG